MTALKLLREECLERVQAVKTLLHGCGCSAVAPVTRQAIDDMESLLRWQAYLEALDDVLTSARYRYASTTWPPETTTTTPDPHDAISTPSDSTNTTPGWLAYYPPRRPPLLCRLARFLRRMIGRHG